MTIQTKETTLTRIREYVIYPKNGYIAEGAPFVTTTWDLGTDKPTDDEVLHAWWRRQPLEAVRRKWGYIRFDDVARNLAVFRLGRH